VELSSILIPLASSQHNLYDIYLLLCVQCSTPDDGQRNCPKHVELHSKNKFEKLGHLFGFIIRIRESSQSLLQISNYMGFKDIKQRFSKQSYQELCSL
jgi:hypothetical protein